MQRKYLLIVSISLTIIFILYALLPYISAILGAGVLYILLKTPNILLRKRVPSRVAAAFILILSLFFIFLLVFIIGIAVVRQFEAIVKLSSSILGILSSTSYLSGITPQLSQLISSGSTLLLQSVQSVTTIILKIFVTCFILYYLLVNDIEIGKFCRKLSPFSKTNTFAIFREFERLTFATVVVAGLIALFQGISMGIIFWALHIPNALLWGVISVILAFIPVLGIFPIWGIGSVIFFIQGDIAVAATILISGIVLSSVDNLIRPFLQNKIGSINPVISLLGLLIGIPFFGLAGIVLGPLIIASTLSALRFYREEYS